MKLFQLPDDIRVECLHPYLSDSDACHLYQTCSVCFINQSSEYGLKKLLDVNHYPNLSPVVLGFYVSRIRLTTRGNQGNHNLLKQLNRSVEIIRSQDDIREIHFEFNDVFTLPQDVDSSFCATVLHSIQTYLSTFRRLDTLCFWNTQNASIFLWSFQFPHIRHWIVSPGPPCDWMHSPQQDCTGHDLSANSQDEYSFCTVYAPDQPWPQTSHLHLFESNRLLSSHHLPQSLVSLTIHATDMLFEDTLFENNNADQRFSLPSTLTSLKFFVSNFNSLHDRLDQNIQRFEFHPKTRLRSFVCDFYSPSVLGMLLRLSHLDHLTSLSLKGTFTCSSRDAERSELPTAVQLDPFFLYNGVSHVLTKCTSVEHLELRLLYFRIQLNGSRQFAWLHPCVPQHTSSLQDTKVECEPKIWPSTLKSLVINYDLDQAIDILDQCPQLTSLRLVQDEYIQPENTFLEFFEDVHSCADFLTTDILVLCNKILNKCEYSNVTRFNEKDDYCNSMFPSRLLSFTNCNLSFVTKVMNGYANEHVVETLLLHMVYYSDVLRHCLQKFVNLKHLTLTGVKLQIPVFLQWQDIPSSLEYIHLSRIVTSKIDSILYPFIQKLEHDSSMSHLICDFDYIPDTPATKLHSAVSILLNNHYLLQNTMPSTRVHFRVNENGRLVLYKDDN